MSDGSQNLFNQDTRTVVTDDWMDRLKAAWWCPDVPTPIKFRRLIPSATDVKLPGSPLLPFGDQRLEMSQEDGIFKG